MYSVETSTPDVLLACAVKKSIIVIVINSSGAIQELTTIPTGDQVRYVLQCPAVSDHHRVD
jgi:hypothetical protein